MNNSVGPRREEDGSWMVAISGWGVGVLIIMAVICIGYSMYAHGVARVAKISFLMGLPFSIGIIGYSLYSSETPKKAWYGWRGVGTIVLIFLFSFVFLLTLYSVGMCATDLFGKLWSDFTNTGRFSVIVGALTLIFGGALFFMRLRWRATYGITEVMVGVFIASHRAYGESGPWSEANSDFYLAVLAGGIYLVVRGLDNVHQGMKLANDPVVIFVAWVKSKVLIKDPEKIRQAFGE